MEIEREDFGDTAVIRCLEDRLDAVIAVQFKDKFRGFADDGTTRFVLDMSRIEFMDSSGLGAIVAVYKLLGQDKLLDLAALTQPVERVFKLTRMDSVFNIYADTDAALLADTYADATRTAS